MLQAKPLKLQRCETEFDELSAYGVFIGGKQIGRVAKILSGHYGRRWNGKGYYSDRTGNAPQFFARSAWTYSPNNPFKEELETRKSAVESLLFAIAEVVE